jgi:hypothetical protein
VAGAHVSWEHIPGYSGFLWLYDRAVEEASDGAIFVEVGVALGHSIAYLARKVLDSGKRIEVWAVDPWAGYARNGEQQEALGARSKGDFRLFLDSMGRHAPEELELVRVVRARSELACRMFDVGTVDMVLIDGAHDERSVRDDVSDWSTRVNRGGVLAGDDHEPNYPGVEAACVAAFGTAYEVTGTTWHKRM